MAKFNILSWQLLGETEKNLITFSQDLLSSGLDLNLAPSAYKGGMVTACPLLFIRHG
jgi:hypothetical protein